VKAWVGVTLAMMSALERDKDNETLEVLYGPGIERKTDSTEEPPLMLGVYTKAHDGLPSNPLRYWRCYPPMMESSYWLCGSWDAAYAVSLNGSCAAACPSFPLWHRPWKAVSTGVDSNAIFYCTELTDSRDGVSYVSDTAGVDHDLYFHGKTD
jgi:hypothetical protein